MVNELRQGNDDLVPVDYSSILQQILRILEEQNPFAVSENKRILTINLDEIAAAAATSRVQNPLSATKAVRSATVNFSRGFENNFPAQIKEIKERLERHLESLLPGEDIEDFLNNLTSDLASFQGEAEKLGLSYPFNKPSGGLQKQELTIGDRQPGSNSLLKFHKLTIAVGNVTTFQGQLNEGLENHIDNYFEGEEEEDLEGVYNLLESDIANPSSDFNLLQNLVDAETLGKLKKEAKIVYLEHLLNNVETQDTLGVIYLRDLIRRLKLIEEYINSKASGELEVYYGGAMVNYQDIFSRAETLDALPVIPIVAGILGESTDIAKGETQFVLGLKMKLDGKVQTSQGEDVFEYNLGIINPDSDEHIQELGDSDRREKFARKVLIRVFLYYFVFASRCNPKANNYDPNLELEYDPRPGFEEKVLPILKGSNEEAKRELFRGFRKGLDKFNVKSKVDRLCKLLKKFIEAKTILPTGTYNRQISVSREILTKDSDNIFRGSFFVDLLRQNPKQCLRYISIGESAVEESALCQLPASIKIEDIRYFLGGDRQRFQFEWEVKGIKTLPVFWIPKSTPCLRHYRSSLEKQYKHILFSYDNTRLNSDNGFKSDRAFVYRFAWTLLSYICLYLLLEEKSRTSLFVPMVRLHQGTDKNPRPAEKFLAHLSKVLCHLFSQNHRCNSQGFRVNQTPNNFTVANGLNSLYSVLPKKFRVLGNSPGPSLDKLAIIIVSSQESDARFASKNREGIKASLIGEIFSIERLEDGAVKIKLLQTFSANYSRRKMYREPTVLIEDMMNYLTKQGYEHYLYVARAPHTSTLHFTQTDEEKGLYFMSPKIIEAMKKGRENIKIYPVFFDKYYVKKFGEKEESLYLQDTEELTNIAEDSTQKSVVFFNLFNGITVGKKGDRFYNGVISYSTLLGNFYSGVMEDKDIRQGLLYDSPLKDDILQYLTFFHFYRFERKTKISFKLDPYENIIGDDAVGSLSVFPQMTEKIDFNSLAFLIEVNKVVEEF
ncbi:MAG: hypothetical protein SXA11_00520 [Cyanobacteriota bacterium]|nr:hypothetical protein [Cyanobacteriota bacterium]